MVAAQNDSKIPVGTVLVGKYRVTREIGRGGMAAVYEAVHLALGKKVAVKVLAAELSTSSVVIERFFREARAAASVKSPYIVDVYDSSRLEDGRPFIAMEMLEGESLYDRMARVRLIDPQSTVRIIAQCAKGLTKAHGAGIVHRDLKPENIFLLKNEEGEDTVKLLDFGLAKFYAPVASDEKTARLTREGAVFGTPAYMSPEQVKGQGNVDHRADLWALGCMAFECLIGRPVWNTDQGVAMTFAAIAAANPPVPSKLRSDLPPAFDEWFRKALSRDPNQRFQSAKELADALGKALTNTSAISLPNVSGDGKYNISDVEAMAEQLPSAQVQLEPPTPHLPVQLQGAGRAAGGLAGPPGVPSTASGPGLFPPGVPSTPSRPSGGATPANGQGHAHSSANEMPGTATPESVVPPGRTSPGAGRLVLSALVLAGSLGLAYTTWSKLLRPQILTPIVEPPAPTAGAVSDAGVAAVAQPSPDEPRWVQALAEGQALVGEGAVEAAIKRFKDAVEMGGTAGKPLADHVRAATTGAPGPCRLAAIAQPRLDVPGSAQRPAVAATAKGAVVTWTDDHEQAGHDHAYSVLLDAAGRPTSRPRDVTPEANDVGRPALLAVGDRMVLLYWDKGGREAGVRVRWLDDDGRISGSSLLVGASRTGNFWPSIERSASGFVVVWQDDRDKDGDDLFMRRLGAGLEPQGNEIRVTDYVPTAKNSPHVRTPSVAVANSALFLVYKLERGPSHMIQGMYLPLGTAELSASGLAEGRREKKDRVLGSVAVVNEDRAAADAPQVACGKEGCFVVWHGEKGGAYAAMMEPTGGNVVWRKRFAPQGGHPSLGTNHDGEVAAAFMDQGRVRLVALTRDGIGAPSTLGKVSGDQPRPWITGGVNRGEWYVAWQDFEASRTQPFVARAACR